MIKNVLICFMVTILLVPTFEENNNDPSNCRKLVNNKYSYQSFDDLLEDYGRK